MAQPWDVDYSIKSPPQAAAPTQAPATPPVVEQYGATHKQPWEQDYSGGASNNMSTADTVADVTKSALTGPVKGTIGLAGQFGDIGNLLERGISNVIDYFQPNIKPEEKKVLMDHFHDRVGFYTPYSPDMPTSATIRGGVEKVTGPLHDPQTPEGHIAQAPGEWLPAALTMSPGGLGRRIVGGAVIPGVVSETAGQMLDSTGYGNYARIATGLLTGAMNAATVPAPTAVAAIKMHLPEGVTPQIVDQAGALMASPAGRQVNMTWPEALSQVAGRPILLDLQRLTESGHQARSIMQDFMAQRPGQVQRAVEGVADRITPATNQPSMIGPQTATAAQSAINDTRNAINELTRGMYQAAEQHRVPAADHARMLQDPVFSKALDAVRESPDWRREIGAQSDRSFKVYDAVKRELQENAENYAVPATGDTSHLRSSSRTSAANEVRDLMISAERQATGGPSSYEAALENQARMRQTYLEPLQRGPLGRVADAPETKRAVEALFPSQATAGSAAEVSQAVSAMAARNPEAARQLVRQHILMELDNAFQSAGRGHEAAQFAGATWAKNLVGNPAAPSTRAQNLQAAITALPGGQGLWAGVRNLLDVTQATGQRMAIGSRTPFNERDMARLSTGGVGETLIKHGLAPGEWWHVMHDAVSKWQLGRNMPQIAQIITNPQSATILRTLGTVDPKSARAVALVARLVAQNQIAGSSRATDQLPAPKGE